MRGCEPCCRSMTSKSAMRSKVVAASAISRNLECCSKPPVNERLICQEATWSGTGGAMSGAAVRQGATRSLSIEAIARHFRSRQMPPVLISKKRQPLFLPTRRVKLERGERNDHIGRSENQDLCRRSRLDRHPGDVRRTVDQRIYDQSHPDAEGWSCRLQDVRDGGLAHGAGQAGFLRSLCG